MKRTSKGLLIPVALLLAWSVAWAGSDQNTGATTGVEQNSPEQSRQSFKLFGRTYCLPDAPADMRCDFRFSHRTAEREAQRPRPRVFNLFGVELCFGDVTTTTRCDLRVPAPSRSERRASL